VIYISGIFAAIESSVPGVRSLSFAEDIGLVVAGSSAEQVCEKPQQAGGVAVAWGQQIDMDKTEAVLFTRKKGRRLRELTQRARITLGGRRVQFCQEATRWLGVWLDAGLTLKTLYQKRLQKARSAEARVRSLCRRIQVAAAQAVALYEAELCSC
jgi:hypothetical protein